MRKLLTLFAFTCCCAPSIAQTELGVNGGLLVNKTPWIGGGKVAGYTQSARPSGYGSVKLLIHMRNNWQMGIGIDIATIKSDLAREVSKAPPKTVYGTIQIGAPNIPLYLMLNRTIRVPGGYAYAGLNTGITFITGTGGAQVSNHLVEDTDNHGFQVGMQLGYTRWLVGHLGANIEAGIRYMTTGMPNPQPGIDVTYDIWYVPASIGIRYSL
ncbi:MAG: hypothetical protein EOP56_08120 [Sphingobacteriales bacterium]|nr:MAG: hypothetical protein EOP56_08120 [Sphingobacteriales bacterium]